MNEVLDQREPVAQRVSSLKENLMFSAFTWFWIIYFSIGLLIMMEPLVTVWDNPDYQELNTLAKIVAAFISIIVWPLLFFVD
jgi:hypothetical protein